MVIIVGKNCAETLPIVYKNCTKTVRKVGKKGVTTIGFWVKGVMVFGLFCEKLWEPGVSISRF